MIQEPYNKQPPCTLISSLQQKYGITLCQPSMAIPAWRSDKLMTNMDLKRSISVSGQK